MGGAGHEPAADGIPGGGRRGGVLHPRRRGTACHPVRALAPDQGARTGGGRRAVGADAARGAADPHGPGLLPLRRTRGPQRPAGPPRRTGGRRGGKRRTAHRHGACAGHRRAARGLRPVGPRAPRGAARPPRIRHHRRAVRPDGARRRRCGGRPAPRRLAGTGHRRRTGGDRAGRAVRRPARRPAVHTPHRPGGPALGALQPGAGDRRRALARPGMRTRGLHPAYRGPYAAQLDRRPDGRGRRRGAADGGP